MKTNRSPSGITEPIRGSHHIVVAYLPFRRYLRCISGLEVAIHNPPGDLAKYGRASPRHGDEKEATGPEYECRDILYTHVLALCFENSQMYRSLFHTIV